MGLIQVHKDTFGLGFVEVKCSYDVGCNIFMYVHVSKGVAP